MRKLLLLCFSFVVLFADADDIQKMLLNAKTAFSTQETINYEREQRFLNDLKQQKKLLADAQAQVARLKQESIKLNNTIDKNEKLLSKLEEKLHQRSGNLGELYGVVRQSAGDMYGQLQNSATSAQKYERLEFLQELSKSTKLPNTEKLSTLYFTMLQELTLQGANEKVILDVIEPNGSLVKQEVLLNGVFSASTKDGFVEYLESSHTYSTLSKQPSSTFLNTVQDAFESSDTLYETVIDPTRGQLLSLSTETPTISERIEQGSTIGYLILILGVLGLSYAFYRGVKLFLLHDAIVKNKESSMVLKLQKLYEYKKHLNTEQLELRFQERLSQEKTKIEKGIPLIKLLAAVAPLMGLLGTVTGMIATFSAITLFGTGDPKLMAGGISQALITTVEGLVVAIPLLFSFTFLQNKAKVLVSRLDEEALNILSNHENINLKSKDND